MARRHPDPLEQAWNRRALMIDLAHGKKSQTQLAGEFGVAQASVSLFKSRHAEEIQAIRDNDMDEYTGIALAKKSARLDTYREILEACLTPTPKVAGKDGAYVRDVPQGDGEDGEIVYEIDAAAAVKVLRNIAEELGQLPSRVVVTGGIDVKTNYQVNGVDPENLK